MGNKPTYEELEQRVKELEGEVAEFKRTQKELQVKKDSLEDLNAALRALLQRKEEDRKNFEARVFSNVKELVVPFVEKLKKSRLDNRQAAYLQMLESMLNDIVLPFSHTLSAQYLSFTPREIRIATLIKEGLKSEVIAEMMNLSKRTVDSHRGAIRKKLGLRHKKVNLRSKLLSI